MTTRKSRVRVTVTPGHNAPVDNVVHLEDLLREMAADPARPARGAKAAPANPTQALVLDLAARLSAARQSAVKPRGKRR